jgi:hypothetical protein
MNFVTCDGVEGLVSFRFYVKPYDLASWLLILCLSIVLLPATVWLGLKTADRIQSTGLKMDGLISDSLLFNISTNLDVSPTLPPRLSRNPRLSRLINMTLGLWVVACVTLVNAYRGLIVSELTSSLSLTRTITKFSQTDGFLFFGSGVLADKMYDSFHSTFNEQGDYAFNYSGKPSFLDKSRYDRISIRSSQYFSMHRGVNSGPRTGTR